MKRRSTRSVEPDVARWEHRSDIGDRAWRVTGPKGSVIVYNLGSGWGLRIA